MDNCTPLHILNSDIEEASDAVICKRRSFALSRRSKLFIEEADKAEKLEDTGSQSIHNHKRQCLDDIRRKENFYLQKYIDDLVQERKMWIATLKERKSERRFLSKQKSSLEQRGQHLDLKTLSDSERSFLIAHPNYEYIYKNTKNLSETGLKIVLLNELIYKLNERFMLRIGEKLCMATKKIIKMSG